MLSQFCLMLSFTLASIELLAPRCKQHGMKLRSPRALSAWAMKNCEQHGYRHSEICYGFTFQQQKNSQFFIQNLSQFGIIMYFGEISIYSIFRIVLLIDQLLFRIESILAEKTRKNTTQMSDVGEMGQGDEVLGITKTITKHFS